MNEENVDNEILDEFGKMLMEEVRDRVIFQLDILTTKKSNNPTKKFLDSRINLSDKKILEAISLMIPIAVDSAIDHFLGLIEDQENIDLVMIKPSGNHSIKNISDGLAGELYSEEGFIRRFSKERNYEEEVWKDYFPRRRRWLPWWLD